MTLRRILSAVFVPLFLFMAVVFPMEKSYATGSLNLLYNHQMLINIGSQKQWAEKQGMTIITNPALLSALLMRMR